MFYVVIPYVRGWIESENVSFEAAERFIKNSGFTGWIYESGTNSFVKEVKSY